MWNKRGVSLYIAIAIMAILLASVLGIGGILVSQIKTMRGVENSVIAFYAADSGIEEVLMNWTDPVSSCSEASPCLLDNEATYVVTVLASGDAGCILPDVSFCITSVGTYQGTRRAIRVEY